MPVHHRCPPWLQCHCCQNSIHPAWNTLRCGCAIHSSFLIVLDSLPGTMPHGGVIFRTRCGNYIHLPNSRVLSWLHTLKVTQRCYLWVLPSAPHARTCASRNAIVVCAQQEPQHGGLEVAGGGGDCNCQHKICPCALQTSPRAVVVSPQSTIYFTGTHLHRRPHTHASACTAPLVDALLLRHVHVCHPCRHVPASHAFVSFSTKYSVDQITQVLLGADCAT
jgi:hypothetical protein